MTNITILGGTGYAGSTLAKVAAAAGLTVTSISRTPAASEDRIDGVTYLTGSVLDDATLARGLDGADVVVSALAPRGEMLGKTRAAIADLAGRAEAAGVRLGVIGGAGSLFVAEGGPKLFDTDAFPDAVKPEAFEMAGVLDDLRASDETLDWFYVSPAAAFGAWAPGEQTGVYRVGGDILLSDEAGNSAISGLDLATAIVDEIETPKHRRQRFTVAY